MKDSKNTGLHYFSRGVCSGSDDSNLNNSRNIVLNQLYLKIPNTGGVLLGSLKDKTHVHSCGDVEGCPSVPGAMTYRTHNIDKGTLRTCNGLSTKTGRFNTDLCRQVFLDIVKSEEFAHLCDLVLKNYEREKIDSILDILPINSRMTDGEYEKSPMLFHSDMQKFLEHLQKVGGEISSLSKYLLDYSEDTCSQQFPESVRLTKLEKTEACDVPKVCTCQRCGEKVEGRDYLVCDSCEEMYHVSCIQPAVEEVPIQSWYCINCIPMELESPHDSCIACEKLHATLPPNNRVHYEELSMEFRENSNGLSYHEVELRNGGNKCNICKIEVLNGKKKKVCGHSLCPHRYYHINCLTNKQLRTYGPCWYCPSCLCRACLTDQDDHAIVLCDGCDSAYHIYCLQPPHTEIPEGSWFCMICDVDLQKIATAKREFERLHMKLGKRGEDRIGIEDDEAVGKSVEVDILL